MDPQESGSAITGEEPAADPVKERFDDNAAGSFFRSSVEENGSTPIREIA